MYSRYGQVLTEQHNVFLKKDDILQGNLRVVKMNYSVLQKVSAAHQFEDLGSTQQPEEAEERSGEKLQLAIPEPPPAPPEFNNIERESKRRKKELSIRKLNKMETPGPNKYHVKLAQKYLAVTQREHASRLRRPEAGASLSRRCPEEVRLVHLDHAAEGLSEELLVARESEVPAGLRASSALGYRTRSSASGSRSTCPGIPAPTSGSPRQASPCPKRFRFGSRRGKT